jgi:hypothetical protein
MVRTVRDICIAAVCSSLKDDDYDAYDKQQDQQKQ